MEEPEKKKVRLIKALDSMIYMPKLKQTRDSLEIPGLALTHDHILEVSDVDRKRRDVPCIGRPWDRGELYARLQTFKSMTWFAKPEKVNARECARRGWENTGVDELTCETCHTVLKYPSVESLECEQVAGERFEKSLSLSHDQMCPWRSAVCSLSLLEFPKHLSAMTIAADFKSRSAVLQKLLCIPPIAKEAVDVVLPESDSNDVLYILKNGMQLEGTRKQWMESEEYSEGMLGSVRESLQGSSAAYVERDAFLARVRMLALCGWSMKILSFEESNQDADVGHCLPEHAALICNLCGSKIGLWSFFEGCTPKPFSAASVVQKSGHVYKTGKSSLFLNHQVAMNITTTIAGGMLHQMDDLLMQGTDGPFGKSESEQAQPFASPGGRNISREENTESLKESSCKAKAPQRRQTRAIAQYKSACTGSIDPLDSHRFFCPWVNSPYKGGEGEKVQPGWKVYVENLASGPGDILLGTQEWQGKDVFKKVISSVGKFPNRS